MSVRVSQHAIDRYIERVEPVTEDAARSILSSDIIQAAAKIGCPHVKMPCGCSAVIANNTVVTVVTKTVKPFEGKKKRKFNQKRYKKQGWR